MLYSVRMRASSVSSAAGSRISTRCGQSPFRWLKNDSTCAWSVGVPGRPWCWAIAISAMNWRVSIAVISGAVVRPGDEDRTLLVLAAERQPIRAEQPLVLKRRGEQQLHLSVGLLGREQVADPVAGDDVDDRVRDPLGAGEVGRVPDPDPVLFPGNLGKRRLRRSRAEPLARQRDPVLERDPQHRGGRDEHAAGVAAAVRELAMRAIDPDPRSRSDRGSPAPPTPAARGPRRRPDGRPPGCRSPAAAHASDAPDCQADQAPGTPARAPTHPPPPRRSAPAARA